MYQLDRGTRDVHESGHPQSTLRPGSEDGNVICQNAYAKANELWVASPRLAPKYVPESSPCAAVDMSSAATQAAAKFLLGMIDSPDAAWLRMLCGENCNARASDAGALRLGFGREGV